MGCKKNIFDWHYSVVLSAESAEVKTLEISWKYPQIVSKEDPDPLDFSILPDSGASQTFRTFRTSQTSQTSRTSFTCLWCLDKNRLMLLIVFENQLKVPPKCVKGRSGSLGLLNSCGLFGHPGPSGPPGLPVPPRPPVLKLFLLNIMRFFKCDELSSHF